MKLGQWARVDDSKSSDALLLRCSDAEVGQDRVSGVDRPSTGLPLIVGGKFASMVSYTVGEG